MTLQPANHFEASGQGVQVVLDVDGLSGGPVITLQVDGNDVADPSLAVTEFGFEVSAVLRAVPDVDVVSIRLVLPEVNVGGTPAVVTGFAVLVVGRSSIGGPPFVDGAVQGYAIRPVAGTASLVNSVRSPAHR